MQTITISKTYTLKWQLKDAEHYKVSPCGKVFNTQRNIEIRKIINGGSKGFCISGKFVSLPKLRSRLILIPKKEILPF